VVYTFRLALLFVYPLALLLPVNISVLRDCLTFTHGQCSMAKIGRGAFLKLNKL